MSRVTRVLARLGFGMMVIGALAFGASQALATTGSQECSLCNYPEQLPCQTCCHDELGFDTGTCFPSGSCVCW